MSVRMEQRATLEAVAAKWLSYWQGALLEDFEQTHAPGFADHSASGRPQDRAGLLQGVRDLYAAFPDFTAKAEQVAVDQASGLVTILWSATGHMVGPFLGAAATGRLVRFKGIELIRIRDAKVVERWGEWDEAALKAQINGPGNGD